MMEGGEGRGGGERGGGEGRGEGRGRGAGSRLVWLPYYFTSYGTEV